MPRLPSALFYSSKHLFISDRFAGKVTLFLLLTNSLSTTSCFNFNDGTVIYWWYSRDTHPGIKEFQIISDLCPRRTSQIKGIATLGGTNVKARFVTKTTEKPTLARPRNKRAFPFAFAWVQKHRRRFRVRFYSVLNAFQVQDKFQIQERHMKYYKTHLIQKSTKIFLNCAIVDI